jgi:hypothetical protein
MIKTAQEFFNTNLNDAISHCVATARKFDADGINANFSRDTEAGNQLFGFGGNAAADKLISDTVTAVYRAVYAVLNAPALWIGTHSASLEARDDVAIAAGRTALAQAVINSNFPERDTLWLFEKMFGLPDITSHDSPTPAAIRAARDNLSQTAAAALIGKPLKTWQNWEAPINSQSHRNMDPALFELFLLKVTPHNSR